MSALGRPHLHYATTESTNDRARALAIQGAPHGTIVTAREQTAGRGRRGRSWVAPAGQALLLSVVLRDAPDLLTLRAGVAVAETCGPSAMLKWPNDVVMAERKVAGILCEQRTGENWAVVGIGVNVAVELERLPAGLRDSAGTLALAPGEVPAWRGRLLDQIDRALALSNGELIAGWSDRDCLRGRAVRWSDGEGVAAGIDKHARLLVDVIDASGASGQIALESGEVSLVRAA